jgi:hypothetical protein
MAIAAAAVLALMPGRAGAQTMLELFPRASLTGEYTDNLLLSSVDKKTDGIGIATVGGTLAAINEWRDLELNYLTDFQLYAQHSHYDSAAQDHYVGLTDDEHLSAATDLSWGDTFIKGRPVFGQGLLGASGISPQLSQALLQTSFLSNTFYGTLRHQFDQDFSASLGAHQTYYSTSAAGTTNTDSFNQGGLLEGDYKLAERTTGILAYDFEDFRYSNFPRTDTHAPAAGLGLELAPGLQGRAQVGPLIVDSSSGVSVDVGYTASGSYRTGGLLLSLNSSRQAGSTAGFAGAGVSQSVGGSIAYQLTPRTNAYLNSGYTKISAGAATSEILNYSAGINYQYSPEFGLFVQYLWFRSSVPTGPATTTNTVGVGFNLTPRPWHWVL